MKRLHGPWALFFLGEPPYREDEPVMVGHDDVWLRKASSALWSHDYVYVGLWETKEDREHTLREVRTRRAGILPQTTLPLSRHHTWCALRTNQVTGMACSCGVEPGRTLATDVSKGGGA